MTLIFTENKRQSNKTGYVKLLPKCTSPRLMSPVSERLCSGSSAVVETQASETASGLAAEHSVTIFTNTHMAHKSDPVTFMFQALPSCKNKIRKAKTWSEIVEKKGSSYTSRKTPYTSTFVYLSCLDAKCNVNLLSIC